MLLVTRPTEIFRLIADRSPEAAAKRGNRMRMNHPEPTEMCCGLLAKPLTRKRGGSQVRQGNSTLGKITSCFSQRAQFGLRRAEMRVTWSAKVYRPQAPCPCCF